VAVLLVRARWVAVALLAGGALAGIRLGVLPQGPALLSVAAALLVLNVAIAWSSARAPKEQVRTAAFRLGQAVADLSVLTAVVYFWGGVESPAAVFYLVPVVWAASAVRGPSAYLVAACATGLFGAVAAVQTAVPALFHPIMAGLSGHYYQHWPLVALSVGLMGVAAHGAVYLTAAAARRTAGPGGTPDCDLLSAVVTSVTEGLIYLNCDGTVEMWNPAVASWFGERLHEPGAEPPPQSALPEGLRHFVERVRTSPAPVGPERFLVSVPSAPREPPRRFRAYAAAVHDEEGEHVGYAVVAVDVTEQLQFEEELRARNHERNREILVMAEALQRNQQAMSQHEKMVAIGTMAAGIAHEIGNPLASLSAVVQLLRRRPRSEQDARRLQTLEEQIERIARIVRQMLEFSRPAATDWVEADIDELTEQTVTMVCYSHRARSAEIQSARNTDLPKMRTMPQLFQQVLVNLLLNALDAVDEKQNGGLIRVERALEGDRLKVRVVDEGVGMTEEQIRHAFEPFYSTKPPGRGTGLGLAVSYRLVERLGGHIGIVSTPGEGTTVTVSFKIGQPAAEAVGTPSPDAQP
jgi:signal transduction histidine kinase